LLNLSREKQPIKAVVLIASRIVVAYGPLTGGSCTGRCLTLPLESQVPLTQRSPVFLLSWMTL